MNRLRHNALAKILSLVAAIVLWVYVMNEQNPNVQVTYTVPVKVENLSSANIIENAPKTIRVSLAGPRNVVLHLDPNSLISTLNLKNVAVGEHKLPISFNPPTGLAIISQSPAQADVYVDQYTVKELSLRYQPTGKLPENYTITETKLVPEKVVISGAKRRVEQVTNAYISSKIDSVPANNMVTEEGYIRIISSTGKEITGVTITPLQGKAIITLKKTNMDKSITIEPNIIGSPAPGYKVESVNVIPKQAAISGKSDVIKGLNIVKTEPIDIAGATEDVKRMVSIQDMDGLDNVDSQVEVNIHIVKDKGDTKY